MVDFKPFRHHSQWSYLSQEIDNVDMADADEDKPRENERLSDSEVNQWRSYSGQINPLFRSRRDTNLFLFQE